MKYRRVTLICGHYGSGKTNIAVNMALDLRKQYDKVSLADLDIVNPYFRAMDSKALMEENDIGFICSPYANSNIDIPAMPPEMYSIRDDRSTYAILDIGGDERGALALGRLAPFILEENDYEMLMVVNCHRPLTTDVPSTLVVKEEIENACGIRFTGIINNSNLGRETTTQIVLDSLSYAEDVSKATGLPIVMTTVEQSLYPELAPRIDGLFPLTLTEIP